MPELVWESHTPRQMRMLARCLELEFVATPDEERAKRLATLLRETARGKREGEFILYQLRIEDSKLLDRAELIAFGTKKDIYRRPEMADFLPNNPSSGPPVPRIMRLYWPWIG